MSWTEADSTLYQALAAVAVPDRAEQIATLLALLPLSTGEIARVVELGCGEGYLAAAVLTAYPRVSLLALDGSDEMRAQATARLRPFGGRGEVGGLDLQGTGWFAALDGVDAVVSSLALHHLDEAGKRQLFEAVAQRLSPGGALLIADLVEPKRAEALTVFAAGWDAAAERQSQTKPGSAEALERFKETRWNIFAFPDPQETPSPLFEQLTWLREAGFSSVDCYWLRAGHAVYGGYRSRARTGGPPLAFAEALRIAEVALN
ncbi:MAG: class I SAM-dependent methyltransferase [Chloroflexi bacterium]|nr:class I SAM-dependent methyltransferase [Chloroflexota bacterium]